MSDWTPWYVRVFRALFRRRVVTKPETMTWEYRRVGNVVETRTVAKGLETLDGYRLAVPHQPVAGDILIEGTYEVSAPVETE